LAAFGFARYLWGTAGGWLAAVAYTYFPYHLADAYLRGAIPEHFAFIWPPLILWAYTAAFREEKPLPPLLWGTLAWAGLLYTHNLTALLMAPVAVVYVMVMAAWTKRWSRLLPVVGLLVVAVALSAPLWGPFLAESGDVGIGLGPSDGYKRHLAPPGRFVLFSPLYRYRLEHGGQVDHPLSWLTVALCLLALVLLSLRLALRKRAKVQPVWAKVQPIYVHAWPIPAFSLFLAAGAAIMVTTASQPIWTATFQIIGNLQYPWRFLTLVGVGLLGIAGAFPALLFDAGHSAPGSRPIPSQRLRDWGWIGLLSAALIVQPLPNVPAKPLSLPDAETWAPDRMWREDAEVGQVGATWTAEFLPLTVKEQRWALSRSREGANDGPAITPRPQVRLTGLGYDRVELIYESGNPLSVRLHQFHLPAWGATLDERYIGTYPSGELGLVTVTVPTGQHRLSFRFGPTPAWLGAGAAGLLAAVVWAWLAWPRRRSSRGLGGAAIALLALAVILGANGLGLGQRTWVPRPVGAALGNVALLSGYDVTPAREANALHVTLYWFALRDVGTDYKAFVHLLGPDGQVIAQHDGDPVGSYTPTTRWRSGELIADRHRVPLPSGLPPGVYGLKGGLYQLQPLQNLLVDPQTADNRVDLGVVSLPLK
jgi:hypothetical protein